MTLESARFEHYGTRFWDTRSELGQEVQRVEDLEVAARSAVKIGTGRALIGAARSGAPFLSSETFAQPLHREPGKGDRLVRAFLPGLVQAADGAVR
jgi:hypothetical protein